MAFINVLLPVAQEILLATVIQADKTVYMIHPSVDIDVKQLHAVVQTQPAPAPAAQPALFRLNLMHILA